MAVYRMIPWLMAGMLLATTPATAVTLEELLAGQPERSKAQAVRNEGDRLRAERDQRRQERGWELFGGADVGRYNELDLQAPGDSFTGYGMTLGLRYPLLGTLKRRNQALTDSRAAVERQQYQQQLALAEQRLALRMAYADWWQAHTETRLCQAMTGDIDEDMNRVRRRGANADYIQSELMRVSARRQAYQRRCARSAEAASRARQRLQQIAGQAIPVAASPRASDLATDPAPLARWQRHLAQHPLISDRRKAVQDARKASGDSRWYHAVESNVSLAQRTERRFSEGGTGTGLVASINFSVPFDLSVVGSRPGNRASAASFSAAQWRLTAEQETLEAELDRALGDYRGDLDEVAFREQQLDFVRQALTEALERLAVDEDIGAFRLLQARLDLADVNHDWIRAWHLAWQQSAELMLFAEEDAAFTPVMGTAKRQWTGLATPAREGDVPDASAEEPDTWSQHAYVWDSRQLLSPATRDQVFDALQAAGMSGIYLGLSAAQLQEEGQLHQRIRAVLREADERGIAVHLLLGEPLWLLPEHREDLLALMNRLGDKNFASLHLDLEVEQLGWPVPEERLAHWQDTLVAVARESSWPLSLSSHFRWFLPDAPGDACIPCTLQEQGIRDVSLMIYSTNHDRVTELTEAITGQWPDIRFRLAQSVEPELPDTESWAGRSADQLQAKVSRWQDRLSPLNIRGIDWQDWRGYPRQ